MAMDSTLQVRRNSELKAKVEDFYRSEEIDAKLVRSEADIHAGRFYTQEILDARMKERFAHEQEV